MCGIAGIVDLSGHRPVPERILARMARAIFHRGPDEDGFLERPGLGFTNRRLSIVGLADGKQPIANEDGSIVTVFNGEFFDYPEKKAKLEGRGHRFKTHCDTEIIPHLYEEYGESFFEHLHGQFAVALLDQSNQRVYLGRDRFGICPLFWTRQTSSEGDWLLFASEIKALLASGLVDVRADLRGLDQVFHFFAVPGPSTCFAGIQVLQPGHFLKIDLPASGQPARVSPGRYWKMDFPDQGQELDGDPKKLVDQFDQLFYASVERRLRADVPVVSYLSGGIDSSIVVAVAAKIRGESIPTFTIQILDPKLDETSQAAVVSKMIGSQPVIVPIGPDEVLNTYPELIHAAEAPVIDTSCTALLELAKSVHQHGYKVALTGEGSDEWMAGYSWYKIHKILTAFDAIPGLRLSSPLRRAVYRWGNTAPETIAYMDRMEKTLGGFSAFNELYNMMTVSRFQFFHRDTLAALGDHNPYLELNPDFERMKRWHPMNRSVYWAGRIHLPGHLLSLKGDRVAMNSSVETRYPFLDESVFEFLAQIHPRWKMRGFRDKYLLRKLGERYLPKDVAWRPKGMFRAPLDSFFDRKVPAFVEQLLSPESLKKTGYFNVEAVVSALERVRANRVGRLQRTSVELGLVGVVTTQLWHQTFLDSSLAEVSRPKRPMLAHV